jgi:hypothetical protein
MEWSKACIEVGLTQEIKHSNENKVSLVIRQIFVPFLQVYCF